MLWGDSLSDFSGLDKRARPLPHGLARKATALVPAAQNLPELLPCIRQLLSVALLDLGMSSPTSSNPKSGSYLPSPFAAFRKATGLIGHYVDFSDSSSVVSSGSGDPESPVVKTEKSEKSDLQVPLLAAEAEHDTAITASHGPDTPSQSIASSVNGSPTSQTSPQTVTAKQTPDVQPPTYDTASQRSADLTPESSASADATEAYPSPPHLQGRSASAAASVSSDGTQTPKQQEIRTSRLESQPAEEEPTPLKANGINSQAQPDPNDLSRLGSGILDPSLLAPLLSNNAMPEPSHHNELYVPHEPDAHVSGKLLLPSQHFLPSCSILTRQCRMHVMNLSLLNIDCSTAQAKQECLVDSTACALASIAWCNLFIVRKGAFTQ